MRTDAEIIRQTNKLARKLALLSGYAYPEDFAFHNYTRLSTKTHVARTSLYWELARQAQQELTDTDPDDAVDNLGCADGDIPAEQDAPPGEG